MRRRVGSVAAYAFSGIAILATTVGVGSCVTVGEPISGAQTFQITISLVDNQPPPAADNPLPANIGDKEETWKISVQALDSNAQPDPTFNGVVRLSVIPGAIVEVVDQASGQSNGRNLLMQGGVAEAQVTVTAVYGEARLWVEDLGYVPAPPDRPSACANGVNDDDDEDHLVDYPTDPGCEFANDDTETGGTFNAGVSPAVHYALPTIRQIQGEGATTPFPYEAVQANTADPHFLVVTRVARDGFYVTDLNEQGKGFNHLFAFNFSTPPGMQVCDRVTFLAGTLSEFFGFTELNFPSYRLDPLFVGQEDLCQVPEPTVLTPEIIASDSEMEKLESSLVRIEGFQVPKHFGPGLIVNNVPAEGASSCDLNGDGKVDFESDAEGSCSNACDDDPDCSEWTSFIARGNYKVHKDSSVIQIQTDGAQLFNPVTSPGATLTAVTGTMRNFSGGNLNWTIEARCTDDVVCTTEGCAEAVKDSKHACVNLTRTVGDNDEGTN
ncbi:MAG: hypothetical protein U0414_28515 [Polyangiaceae bacterium]